MIDGSCQMHTFLCLGQMNEKMSTMIAVCIGENFFLVHFNIIKTRTAMEPKLKNISRA